MADQIKIDTSVTPSLHPQNVQALADYDSDTRGELGQVETAFSEAYEGIAKVHVARDLARNNPSWTEAAQIVATQDLADKVYERAAARFDKASASMKAGIALLEKDLTGPVAARAAHTISVEIRNYVRGLKAEGGSAMDFVRKAIESGDHDSVSAVLGAPAYLSGLAPEAHAVLLRMYHAKARPVVEKRQRAMKAALALMDERSGLLHKELEKAVGVKPHIAHGLRKAKTAAEQAVVLKDVGWSSL